MEQSLQLYLNSPLFLGVEEKEILPLLACLQAQKRFYARGEEIFSVDSAADKLGIVLAGRVDTIYEDAVGGRGIIGSFFPGQLFCDAFSCSTQRLMPVSAVAQSDSTVVLIDVDRILHTCEKDCSQHRRLTRNLVHILADKYVAISRKMVHLSGRSTRRKLLSYLSEEKHLAGGNPFSIPFSRQELSDYLFVDRTGLSAEWSRLKKQGLLTEKNGLLSLNIQPCAGADCGEAGGTQPQKNPLPARPEGQKTDF